MLRSTKTITILVGGNGTNKDPTMIFQPQEIRADVGNLVVFNCASASCAPPSSSCFAQFCAPICQHLTPTTFSLSPLQLRTGRTPPSNPASSNLYSHSRLQRYPRRFLLRSSRCRQRNRPNDANRLSYRGRPGQNALVLRHLGVWSRWRWSHQRERLGLGELRRVRQECDQAKRDGFHFHFRFQL